MRQAGRAERYADACCTYAARKLHVCCTYADVCCTNADQERQGVKLLQTEMPVTDKTLQALAHPLSYVN